MAINQLFIKKPPIELIEAIFKSIGINLKQGNKFYYTNIEENLKKVLEILLQIKPYYLTCKSKIYFNNLIPKKIITIIRHSLKLYDYKLVSNEIYKNKIKVLEFTVMEINKPVKISLDFN